MLSIVALYRSPSYSPNQHRGNDVAILNAVADRLTTFGHRVARLGEPQVERGCIPAADAYLNMCQGAVASHRLIEREVAGIPLLNDPRAVLNCHRERLVRLIRRAGLPFPETVLVSTRDFARQSVPDSIAGDGLPVWVKRGDVHAETTEDVVGVPPSGLESAVRQFATRGIGTVAVQAHASGPIVKFYGVSGTSFFHCYPAENGCNRRVAFRADRLHDLACRAADALGLEAYGGDAAFPAPDRPVLIDLNDWPSFAPVRTLAAAAIARRFLDLVRTR